MQRYLPLKSQSITLGDEYYKCLNEKLTRQKTQSIDECLEIGRKYKTALEQQLKDLDRLGDPAFVTRERDLVSRYLDLVEHDLNSLSQGEIDKILKGRRPSFDQ